MDEMDADTMRALKKYLGKVYNQMTDTKFATMRWGEMKRDFALLNYNRRTGLDNYLGTVMPYAFWYTHTLRNWALRALSRPTIAANYLRLQEFGKNQMEREGFPTRLKRKAKIEIPYMPEWMGDGVFVDPMRQIFPFEQVLSPFKRYATQQNNEIRRAEGILQEWLQEEEYGQDEITQAMEKREGYIWNKALAQARNEVDGEIQNPLDFAFTMSGPSLPISMAYNWLTGRKDRISQLPVTRGIQAVTGMMGIGGPRGVNLESGVRKAVGLPEVDRFEDYRVDRMLAGMAAEGDITPEAAVKAMIDRSGIEFEAAQRRVSKMGFWQYIGAPVGADFFPEGEEESRALRTEYDKAIEQLKKGDKQALQKFFDAYPEYESRLASFREPDERLKKFLISEVWDRYMALPEIHKENARDQLGDTFTDAFLNKETRSYDSIDANTLAMWARALDDKTLPTRTPDTPAIGIKYAPKETADLVEQFNRERDSLFPGINQFLTSFYKLTPEEQQRARIQNPQIGKYYAWKNKYLAEHPDVIPWTTSEQSELFGLPQDLQQLVYTYRAQRDELFPGIDQIQDGYYAIGNKDGRSDYLAQNPTLREYWDWRRAMAAQNPTAAPYILSDQALQSAILYNQSPALSGEILNQMSASLIQQLLASFYAKESLRPGAYEELSDLWEQAGQPYGTLETWVAKVIRPSLTGR